METESNYYKTESAKPSLRQLLIHDSQIFKPNGKQISEEFVQTLVSFTTGKDQRGLSEYELESEERDLDNMRRNGINIPTERNMFASRISRRILYLTQNGINTYQQLMEHTGLSYGSVIQIVFRLRKELNKHDLEVNVEHQKSYFVKGDNLKEEYQQLIKYAANGANLSNSEFSVLKRLTKKGIPVPKRRNKSA